ncbi:hypothetical protein K8Z49_01405 [Actinomadura madurae]|uniref:hypothetical protein n=1 Tax=Actinomadura madurae TaxID=1993 RepID=UPI00399AD214
MDTEQSNDLRIFCRQVRQRSVEHQEAMPVVIENGWRSISVGILRQELDSMVRVIYLNSQPPERQTQLLADSVNGERWRSTSGKPIFDKQMVDNTGISDGWPKMVYRFGCTFIHLSSSHDHMARDPFQALPRHERQIIVDYINYYHRNKPLDPVTTDSDFESVHLYVPYILEKISTNLEFELEKLEHGKLT